jgi:toxin-antitoxin system PIN domain toxin
VVIVDANVLLHATNESSRQHVQARDWLHEALAGRETVGFAWTVVLAFLRLATNPSVFAQPLGVETAAELAERWLTAGPSVIVEPTGRHLPLLRGLLAEAGVAGNLVGDAHLAALALEHDATVVSFDRDFGRFPGLRHRVPG